MDCVSEGGNSPDLGRGRRTARSCGPVVISQVSRSAELLLNDEPENCCSVVMEVTVGGITGARTISLRRSASVWYTTGVRGRSAGEPGNDLSDAVVYTRRLLPPMTDRDVERRIERVKSKQSDPGKSSQVKSAISIHSRPPSHSIGFRMNACCLCIDNRLDVKDSQSFYLRPLAPSPFEHVPH